LDTDRCFRVLRPGFTARRHAPVIAALAAVQSAFPKPPGTDARRFDTLTRKDFSRTL